MAEDIREVAVISDDHQNDNDSTCDEENGGEGGDLFDGLESELLSLLVPEALCKLFSSSSSTAAVENAGIDDRTVATKDDNELQEVAGILHQTITTFDRWLYETPEGQALQRTILQEFPDLKGPVEEGFRNLLHILAQPFFQLKDMSHPHFEEIDKWFANYHVVLKTAVKCLHGGLAALMNSDACKGHSTLDVAQIVKEIVEFVHLKITDLGKWLFETSEGLALLRAILNQFPADARPDEKECHDLFEMLVIPLIEIIDGSNPLIQEIERWFAGSHVLVQMAVEFFHGGVVGMMNNEANRGLGTLDLPKIRTEMVRIVQQTSFSIDHWLLEKPKGMAILRTILLGSLAPIRPSEVEYRNFLKIMGIQLIQLKNTSNPRFQSVEKFLADDLQVLTMFVKAFHAGLVWSINNRDPFSSMYINVLRILYEINERIGYPLSRRLFWLQGLKPDFGYHFLMYIRNSTSESKVFTWLHVPFLLDVKTKYKFLSLEAVHIMNQCMIKAADTEKTIRQQAQPILPKSLQFHVDRSNIFQSAIENVEKFWHDSESPDPIWLKPLAVNFVGESALDFGGPSKDFFRHFFSTVLNTNRPTSIFKTIDDQNVSSDVWFNPEYLDYCTLEKIGLLFALLIFNGAIATVPFPELLYEKLLSNRDPVPTDLENIDKGFVKQLYNLREMAAEDLEALELDFEGLKTGDENVPVTKENLEMYIEKVMNNRLAIPQLRAFAKGFNRLASMTPLMRKIFNAEDLRDVILGEELDWKAFQQSARYQLPYCEDHPVIKMFWKVFQELEEGEKRQFLKFLTGVDHVPVGGFVPFPVRRLNNRAEKYRHPIEPNKYPEPADLMPEVMTCRGYLSMDLPEYQTEEDLRFRLKLAIHTEGFYREAPSCPHSQCIDSVVARRVMQVGIQLICGGQGPGGLLSREFVV